MHTVQCCKPFQTFQVLEMDAGANVLNIPNTTIHTLESDSVAFDGNDSLVHVILASSRSRIQLDVLEVDGRVRNSKIHYFNKAKKASGSRKVFEMKKGDV